MNVLQGTTFTIVGRFRNPDGQAFNPDTVKVACKRTSGTATYTYGVSGGFTNPATGEFRYTGTLNEPGDWEVVMQGSGTIGAVARKTITVTPLNVVIG
jgi:hypothetical protein